VIHHDDAPNETHQQSPQPSVPWVDVTEELQGQSFTWFGTQPRDAADKIA
jgi:hypothetical protein